MQAIVLAITIFLAPTPEHKDVEVKTMSLIAPSAEACIAAGNVIDAQAHQDPKVLDLKWSCFRVDGNIGKGA